MLGVIVGGDQIVFQHEHYGTFEFKAHQGCVKGEN